MPPNHLQSLAGKHQRGGEDKLKALEKISRLRVGPHLSSAELEREIDRAHAQEAERRLAEISAANPS